VFTGQYLKSDGWLNKESLLKEFETVSRYKLKIQLESLLDFITIQIIELLKKKGL
jgi:hypothetical protein